MSAPFPWQPDASSSRSTVACLNFSSDLHLYHVGFRAGAETLIEALERNDDGQDLLVYPLVCCLRHATEVALKMVIRGARNLLETPGGFPDGHRLDHLWNTARPLLRDVLGDDTDSFDQLASVVASLQTLDPEGEAFRYPVTTKKKASAGQRSPTLDPTLRHLDLRKVYDDVSYVLDLLDGADCGIDVYADYRSEQRQYRDEMRAEYQHEADELRAEMAAEHREYDRYDA